jgi:hypothetical protein
VPLASEVGQWKWFRVPLASEVGQWKRELAVQHWQTAIASATPAAK